MPNGSDSDDGPSDKLEREAKALKAEAAQLEKKAEDLEDRAAKLEIEAEELEHRASIDLIFNDKYQVTVRGREQTGLTLKEAAIKKGVPIHADFVLSIEMGAGKTKLIGDADHIKVKEGERFLAIPNDDNS